MAQVQESSNVVQASLLPDSEGRSLEHGLSSPGFLRKLRGGFLMLVGYLLSPLCWWNDLIINLPVAYGFGYLCRWVSVDWFFPGAIAGYWLSNLVGIVMMQFGAMDMLQNQPQPRNLRKELLTGIATSTAYTVVIVAIVQFKVIDLSAILPEEFTMNLGALLPFAQSRN
jgi:hypothetical protein